MAPHPLRIDVENVALSLGGKPVLRNVSWALRQGEHWALLGPNGAGKSTLLRLLRGDARPDQTARGETKGRCLWSVEGTPDASPLAIRSFCRMVSAENQRFIQRKNWNVAGLGLVLSGLTDSLFPSPADAREVSRAVETARALGAEHLLEKSLSALSQGELRLILLARAAASSPRLLLLDEPFDGLDASARRVLHRAVDRAAETALVVVTAHRAEDVPSCVTHVLRLEKGRVVRCGPLEAAFPQERALLAEHAAARAAAVSCGSDAPGAPRFLLELENADVFVDRAKVLHGLTWRLGEHENWRVAGPNGAGKSVFLRLVAGFEHVALGGRLLWRGVEHPPLETRMRETGYLSDRLHAAYAYDLSGLDLVLSGFDGSVGLWRKPGKREREEALRWIDFLGVSGMARTPLSRLSSGTARKFFLARALVGPVRLLLLDEPCSGLDAPARERFLEALDKVLATGVRCLYVSHHDADVPARAARTLFLEKGRIAAVGGCENTASKS